MTQDLHPEYIKNFLKSIIKIRVTSAKWWNRWFSNLVPLTKRPISNYP